MLVFTFFLNLQFRINPPIVHWFFHHSTDLFTSVFLAPYDSFDVSCRSALTWIAIVWAVPWQPTAFRLQLVLDHLLQTGKLLHLSLQIDLKPMQQLAIRDPYYNILAPQVAGNLSAPECLNTMESSTRTTPPAIMLGNLRHLSWIPSLNARQFTSTPPISSWLLKLHCKDTNYSINRTTAQHLGHPQLALPILENPPTLLCTSFSKLRGSPS